MNTLLRILCCVLLPINISTASAIITPQEVKLQAAPQGPTLEDGTPVKLRISRTLSSADAHLNDRVEFEVLQDIRVADAVIIPQGGIAWGTVTEAKPKRWAGRGGKLEIIMDSVRLNDGEKVALRATTEVKGGGHQVVMTTGIIASGVLFFPVAPLFLFIHGKDIAIQKETEFTAFIKGNFALEMTKFIQAAPATIQPQASEMSSSRSAESLIDTLTQVEITSNPPGAEIEIDGKFVGSTPSSMGLPTGEHAIAVKMSGFKLWERKIKITSGKIVITAELESELKPSETPQ